MSVSSVLIIRTIALVLTHFARIDRFFRAKRYAVHFAGLDGHNGPALALAAVTNSLCHKMPEPHSLASLAPPSRTSIGSPATLVHSTPRPDGLAVLDRLAPTALTALCSLVLHILRASALDHVASPRQRLVPYWVAAPP